MSPARWPRQGKAAERLQVVDPESGRMTHTRVADLATFLDRGDLVVLNDAATLPAALTADSGPELRLAAAPDERGVAWAVLFGPGSWRQRTEERTEVAPLPPGAVLTFGSGLSARVDEVDPASHRLVRLRFDRIGDELWEALYAAGEPVRYSYLSGAAPLALFQTPWSNRPWAVEMPSAGRPLSWSDVLELRRRGIGVATLTHAAGLSSTGDPELDRRLPMPERYDIPAVTAAKVAATRARGGRVVAVGTTVVRALEGSGGQAGEGVTDLRLGPGYRPRIVDGLISGMHAPGESHFELLTAFAPRQVLVEAERQAVGRRYLAHEFGDSCLILPGVRPAPAPGVYGRLQV